MRASTCSLSQKSGFSLIEIILALGIISFAVIGILGLFPVAVEAAANSQRETQAALISRSIFEQLGATPATNLRSIVLAKQYQESNPASIPINLSLSNRSSALIGFSSQGEPLASSNDPTAAYTAQIGVTPLTAPENALSQVLVTVTPVNSKKSKYEFTSILPQK